MKIIKKCISILALITLIELYIYSSLAEETAYVWSNNSEALVETNADLNNDNTNNSLNLESESAILIEQHTGQILYEHNIHEKLRPASVTKIMSILLIMEEIDQGRLSYDTQISCSETAAGMGGSQIWLNTTESLSVNDMLKAICVVSANDCVVAMAEHIAGSQEAFVEKMNNKAKDLGMNDTTFKNCHGIDEEGHLTSCYDISLMSKELLNKYPEITKYTTIWMDSLREGKSELVNTNKLIRNYKGATGLKTGSTSLALYNLSASATRDDLSLIAVIMKAPSTKLRFAEAQKLLDYGFSNFSYKKLGNKGDIVKKININKGNREKVNGILEEDSGTLIKKGNEKNIEQSLNLTNIINAPIKKGDKIGEITYSVNGNTIKTVNIVSDMDVEKLNIFTMGKRIYYSWINLLRS